MVSRYANGPVKPEGICLLPPQHYRMIPSQRSDGYQVSTPPGAYVPNQGNQGGNQGPGLRTMAPTVPPNQASTPPNADIKVQSLSQQPSINPSLFVSQSVRTAQPYYTTRSAPPPSQNPRMSNHSSRPPQQQMYPQQIFPIQQQIYLPTGYFNAGNRPPSANFVQPAIPVYPGPPLTTFPYPASQPQAPSVPYNYFTTTIIPQRSGSIPQPQPPTSNPAQSTMPVPIVPNNPQHQPFQRHLQNKRRPKAISIIDPATGADRLNEMFEEDSHPPSGESSARQTPQPATYNHNKEVQATFAKQVLQAINTDLEIPATLETDAEPLHHSMHPRHHQDPSGDHIIDQNTYTPQPPYQAVQSPITVQSSNFNAEAKEFISTTAKETPIVSANCDAIEVTLPNKLPKDSPGKGRKREQQQQPVKEHKEPVKEQTPVPKDANSNEKQSTLPKEADSKKDTSAVTNATNIQQVPAISKDSSKENIEKKTQRKDSKPEIKLPTPEPSIESQIITPTVSHQQPSPTQDINSNPKSKQNAQRSAAKQTQQNNNAPKPIQSSVPQPQPPKASNKTHKKNELNQKGASKEGTDMDAFNDNAAREEINSNVTVNATTNDIINANSTPIANNTTTPVTRDINVNNEINSKKSDSNELTIKSEPVKVFKPKIDVTDIVKDKPKPIKPYNSTIESQDEPDRAAIPAEKLVQVKNETNAKVSSDTRLENKLPYREGQWTPENQAGSKIYLKDFLIALRDLPSSKVKPENIPDTILADDKGVSSRLSMGGRTDFTNPPFNNFGGKSGSRGGMALPKRNSQSKMAPGKGSKPTMKVSISVKEDVKLHEVENAWRPARFNKGEFATDDDRKTEELYRKVRGVLNKLTPQKFDTLLSQIKSLKIDVPARLQGVIDLVFEKAVDEPNFSVAYALMCKELALMQVPTEKCTEEKPDFVNFRKLLITRCQVEFEKQSVDESIRNTKLKEIEECTDPERKKDLQFDLEEYDRKLRMKSVGNIRFIGELFKQGMLTVNIMMRCLNNLLDNKDEESLECLCKLLSTIGKELEGNRGVNLNPIFTSMKNLADRKEASKVTNRIRFMLQDVIDLKNSKWVPRRQDLNPKTMEQIQKDAENEQMNQMLNVVQITPRKDDRMGGSGNTNTDRKRQGGRSVSDNEGWITSSSNRGRTPFSVQSDKLKSKAPTIDEPLGSPAMFGSWGKGAAMGVKAPPTPVGTNMYATLENLDTEKRILGGRPKDPYSSKGHSMERNYAKFDGRGSRSGSQHRSNDSSASSSQRSTPAPMIPAAVKPIQVVQAVHQMQMTEEQMDRRIDNSLDEFVSGNCSVDEYYQEISSCIPIKYHPKMIANSYLRVLEKSQHARLKTGELFAKLITANRILLEDYCIGLEEILSQSDDLKIDIPKFWDYLADILVDVICEEALPLNKLQQSLSSTISPDNTSKLLAPLFKLIISKKGPVFLQTLWEVSGLNLSGFIDNTQVDSFIEDNHLQILMGGGAMPLGESHLSNDEIQTKLVELFKNTSDFDEIISWVTANIGEKVKDSTFIRTLATAIFEDSISKKNMKAVTDRLSHHNKLLLKYVDNNGSYELQCLYALQALIHRMEHPQGLLLLVCNKLYELGTFSQESFIAWEESSDPAEQAGKGVALKQLVSFFTQLKENDDEESSEEDA